MADDQHIANLASFISAARKRRDQTGKDWFYEEVLTELVLQSLRPPNVARGEKDDTIETLGLSQKKKIRGTSSSEWNTTIQNTASAFREFQGRWTNDQKLSPREHAKMAADLWAEFRKHLPQGFRVEE